MMTLNPKAVPNTLGRSQVHCQIKHNHKKDAVIRSVSSADHRVSKYIGQHVVASD